MIIENEEARILGKSVMFSDTRIINPDSGFAEKLLPIAIVRIWWPTNRSWQTNSKGSHFKKW
jgi:hypothetical protein